MAFVLSNIVVLVLAAVVSWWLSSFDSRITGENVVADNIRRGVRSTISLVLVEMEFLAAWACCHGDSAGGFLYIVILVVLGLYWAGCGSEAAASAFHRLWDPQDDREYDPKKGQRELDAIGGLIRSGRKEEAIKMCRMLLQSPDADRTALELTLHHLGVPMEQVDERHPLARAGSLRKEGKFGEAEAVLNSLLAENPSNVDAAMMLMRIYAQDLRHADKAMEVLRALEQQPHVSPAHIEFARRSIIDESQKPQAKEEPTEAPPESMDELIARRHFGTAIEILERQSKEEPGNFEVWIKLAEVYGKHCANLRVAEKIVRQIASNPAFNAEQIEQARNQLREWREAAPKK
jgi:tetratricopeptide (TPR) repeat protein